MIPKISILGKKKTTRKAFTVSTKKIEWNRAAGRKDDDFKTTSKCRKCKKKLVWGSRTYDFDHLNNNPANNSQRNCYLVCKNCHGHATVTAKRKIKDPFLGVTTGHKTIKKKASYKKTARKSKTTKKKKPAKKKKDPFGLDLPKFRF